MLISLLVTRIADDEAISPIDWSKRKDPRILRRIISEHYQLLSSMAQKTAAYSKISKEELINKGVMGLIVAIDKFDSTKNTKFITYAYYWIKHHFMKLLNNRNIKKPIAVNDVLFDYTNITQTHVRVKDQKIYSSIVLDDSFLQLQNRVFEMFLQTLSSDHKYIIVERLKKVSLIIIANKLKCSKEKVRQTEKKIIKNFKEYAQNIIKPEYIDAYINLMIIIELLNKFNNYFFIAE